MSMSMAEERHDKHIDIGHTGHTDAETRGTLGFATSRSLLGQEVFYRDDLESLSFALAYLLNGELPWSALELELYEYAFSYADNGDSGDLGAPGALAREQMVLAIAAKKEGLSPEELCGDGDKSRTPAAKAVTYLCRYAR
jgi:hypothetical protein